MFLVEATRQVLEANRGGDFAGTDGFAAHSSTASGGDGATENGGSTDTHSARQSAYIAYVRRLFAPSRSRRGLYTLYGTQPSSGGGGGDPIGAETGTTSRTIQTNHDRKSSQGSGSSSTDDYSSRGESASSTDSGVLYWQVNEFQSLATHAKDHYDRSTGVWNREAFFFPTRLLATFFISMFLLGYTMYITVGTFRSLANTANGAANLPSRKAFNALIAAEILYADSRTATAREISREDERWLFDQTKSTWQSFVNLAEVISITSWIGIFLAGFCVAYSWVKTLGLFRTEVLNLRRTGRVVDIDTLRPEIYATGSVPTLSVTSAALFNFLGIAVANTVVSFTIIAYGTTLVLGVRVLRCGYVGVFLRGVASVASLRAHCTCVCMTMPRAAQAHNLTSSQIKTKAFGSVGLFHRF